MINLFSDELKKRYAAFAWQTGMMILAVIIDQLLANLGMFSLPDEATVILGLVLGQVSKYIHNKVRDDSQG
jgi:hypothetical protein